MNLTETHTYTENPMRPDPENNLDQRPDAWDRGWSARQCGSPVDDNPYHGELADWWELGWMEGEIAYD